MACRQAEKELHGLRQATTTPSLSRSPSPRLVHKDDQEQVEAVLHAEDVEDDLGRHTSASTRNVLIRGLSEAMARWKEDGGKVSCCIGNPHSLSPTYMCLFADLLFFIGHAGRL